MPTHLRLGNLEPSWIKLELRSLRDFWDARQDNSVKGPGLLAPFSLAPPIKSREAENVSYIENVDHSLVLRLSSEAD